MSIVQELIKITLDIDDTHGKYAYIPMSKEYRNYTRQKDDLYTELITGALKSGFDTINYALFDKPLRKAIDNAVKEAAIKTGGTWID